jgi:hypothetical protein
MAEPRRICLCHIHIASNCASEARFLSTGTHQKSNTTRSFSVNQTLSLGRGNGIYPIVAQRLWSMGICVKKRDLSIEG